MARNFFSFLTVRKTDQLPEFTISSIFNGLTSKLSLMEVLPRQKLPPQKSAKPVILFNPDCLLIKRYPSFLDLKVVIRPFADLFLFDLAQNYELISYANFTPSESNFIYKCVDPYGCINYRINTKNLDLNRDLSKVVVIETENNQWEKVYDKNILRVEKWNGTEDERLFLLDQFLSNLLYIDKKSWFATLKSYLEVPFFQTYDKVQRKLFFSRNFFWPKYDKFMAQVKNEKVKEFERAKAVMDEQIRKDSALTDWIKPIFGLIRQIIL